MKSNQLVVMAVVAVVLISLGSILFYFQQSSTGSNLGIMKPSAGYSVQPIQVPKGAEVKQETIDAQFFGTPQVVSHAKFLVYGITLGIINTTTTGSPDNLRIMTNFAFVVNSSMIGNVHAGQIIVVSQLGGLAQTGPQTFLNQTYDGFQLLQIHKQYVLALDQNGGILGPDAVFIVRNGLIYSISPDWNLSGVSLNNFVQQWDAISQQTSTTVSVIRSTSTR
ncbi:MAG TPA: hypothetical protein VGR53_10835 [Nitrososphaerales archaeon]|nr:hypothetical protein [Nitrososphaerales archaeon]